MTGRVANWTLPYLASVAGLREIPVEYSVRGITRLDPRINGGRHMRRLMTFAQALSAIEATPAPGVTHYLSMLEIARWLPELQADVSLPLGLEDAAPEYLGAYLFVGGDGTGSTLHYDPTDNYLFVAQGKKEVWLLPPGRLRELRVTPVWQPHCGVSRIEHRDVEAYARTRRDALRCVVGAGDMLYLPQNWWHFVRNRGLTLGVSLSFKWSKASLWRWRQTRLRVRLEIDQWLAAHSAAESLVDYWFASLGWWLARRRVQQLKRAQRNPPPRERPTGSPR
jgi:hypothetical protein